MSNVTFMSDSKTTQSKAVPTIHVIDPPHGIQNMRLRLIHELSAGGIFRE